MNESSNVALAKMKEEAKILMTDMSTMDSLARAWYMIHDRIGKEVMHGFQRGSGGSRYGGANANDTGDGGAARDTAGTGDGTGVGNAAGVDDGAAAGDGGAGKWRCRRHSPIDNLSISLA
jgi:hypothetical protein